MKVIYEPDDINASPGEALSVIIDYARALKLLKAAAGVPKAEKLS